MAVASMDFDVPTFLVLLKIALGSEGIVDESKARHGSPRRQRSMPGPSVVRASFDWMDLHTGSMRLAFSANKEDSWVADSRL